MAEVVPTAVAPTPYLRSSDEDRKYTGKLP